MRRKPPDSASRIYGVLLVIILMVAWEVTARYVFSTVYLTPLSTVVVTFLHDLTDLSFLKDVGSTLARWFTGYLASGLVMIPLGIIMGRFKIVHSLFEPIVEFFRPMPSAAIIPIAILFLGIGTEMKLFVVFFGSSWPILINTIDGVRSIEPTYIQTGIVFGLSPKRILTEIIIPASLPGIATGLRISMAIALILSITVEMIAGGDGIGYYILDAERSFHFSEMYAGVLAIGILGYVINATFILMEKRLLWWYHESRRVTR